MRTSMLAQWSADLGSSGSEQERYILRIIIKNFEAYLASRHTPKSVPRLLDVKAFHLMKHNHLSLRQ